MAILITKSDLALVQSPYFCEMDVPQNASGQEKKTEKAVDLFDKYALEYEGRHMDMALYQDSLDTFCEWLPSPDASVLDLACGPGNVTFYLLQKLPGLKALGLDLSPEMLTLARKNNPQAQFRLMDVRKIGDLEQQFSGIIAGFVSPYLDESDTAQLISSAFALLLPGGAFYLSTMAAGNEGSGWKASHSSQGDEVDIFYHEADFLLEIAQKAGFINLELSQQAFPEEDGSDTTDLILLARKPY